MEICKKVFKWIGIGLAILAGLFVLLIILMTLFPSMRLFGHSYTSNSFVSKETKYTVQTNTNYQFYINTQNFDIEISENAKTEEIIISYENKISGFVTVANCQVTITENNNLFEIRTTEPQGFTWGSGKLKISLPTHSLNGQSTEHNYLYDFTLQTTKGDININHRHINELLVNMGSGDFSWKAEVEVVVEKDEEGNDILTPKDQYIPKEENENPKTKIIPVEKVQLSKFVFFGQTADIDLESFEEIYIINNEDFYIPGEELNPTGSDMLISNDSIELDIKYLAGSIKLICSTIDVDIDELMNYDNLEIIAHKGNIKIGKVYSLPKDYVQEPTPEQSSRYTTISIITNSANVSIGTNYSFTNITTDNGNISIDTAMKYLAISTTKGNISINNAKDEIITNTQSGNISINAYYSQAEIITDTGTIYAHNKGEENATLDTIIIQNSGSITVISENNEMSITSRKGSNITATFRKMCSNQDITHSILNTSGSTQIYILVSNLPFKVRATGNVSGELGNNVKMSSNVEYVTYNPANVVMENYSTLNVEGGTINFSAIYE